MELQYVEGRPVFVKHLKQSDVDSRLVLTTEMLHMIMPRPDPENDTPIRVLDDKGDVYQFKLSVRTGPHPKPVLQAKEWKAFIRKRGARVEHTICFWREVNAIKRTDYGIKLYPYTCYLSPEPEGLSSSEPSSAGADEHEKLAMKAWAAHGLTLSTVANDHN